MVDFVACSLVPCPCAFRHERHHITPIGLRDGSDDDESSSRRGCCNSITIRPWGCSRRPLFLRSLYTRAAAAAATKCVPSCSSGSSSANRTGDDEVDVESEDIKNSVCVLEIQIPLHFHALLRRPALIVYTLFNHDGWLALL